MVFHFTLMSLWKAWIHLFYSELRVNSEADGILLQPVLEKKTLNINQQYST